MIGQIFNKKHYVIYCLAVTVLNLFNYFGQNACYSSESYKSSTVYCCENLSLEPQDPDKLSINDLYKKTLFAHGLLLNGEIYECIDSCNSILKEYENFPDSEKYIECLYNYKATAYLNLGNLYYSKKCFQLALKINNVTNNRQLKNSALINMTMIDIDKRDYSSAFNYSMKLLSDTSLLLSPDDSAVLNSHIAVCAAKLKDTLNATKYFKKLIDLINSGKSYNQYDPYITYRNYGRYLINQHKNLMARKYLDRALSRSITKNGEFHYQTSLSYLYLGDWYTNECFFDSALISYNNSYNGLIHKNKTGADAQPVLIESNYETVLIELLLSRSRMYTKHSRELNDTNILNILKAGFKDIKMGIDRISYLSHSITDDASRFAIADKSREVFNQGVELAIELFKITKIEEYFDFALQWSLQAKSLSIKWHIEKNIGYDTIAIPEDLFLNLLKIRREINLQLNNDSVNTKSDGIENLINKYEEYESQIREKYPQLQNRFNNIWFANNDIHAKETHLSYFNLDSSIIVFVINHKEKYYKSIPLDSAKLKLISNYKKLLTNSPLRFYTTNDLKQFSNLSNQLYKWLIQPFEKIIKGKTLAISPDEILLGIPFETFTYEPINELEIQFFKDMPYLLNKYQIHYFAGPLFPEPGIKKITSSKNSASIITCSWDNNIPGSKNEIKQIENIFHNLKKIYIDKTDTILDLIPRKSDIIHISGHISIDNINPMNSSLCCYNNSITKKLSFQDIMGTSIENTFVYLNGCDSGIGPINKGEGYISLGLAFSIRGSESIVQNLWNTPDIAANEISTGFYSHLNKLDAWSALSHSKKDYIEKSDIGLDHPYYWAGTIYYGTNWKLKNTIKYYYIIPFVIICLVFYLLFLKRNFRSSFLTFFK